MARPVKETPILIGKDARRFEKVLKRNERITVPPAKYQRAIETYDNIKKSS